MFGGGDIAENSGKNTKDAEAVVATREQGAAPNNGGGHMERDGEEWLAWENVDGREEEPEKSKEQARLPRQVAKSHVASMGRGSAGYAGRG